MVQSRQYAPSHAWLAVPQGVVPMYTAKLLKTARHTGQYLLYYPAVIRLMGYAIRRRWWYQHPRERPVLKDSSFPYENHRVGDTAIFF